MCCLHLRRHGYDLVGPSMRLSTLLTNSTAIDRHVVGPTSGSTPTGPGTSIRVTSGKLIEPGKSRAQISMSNSDPSLSTHLPAQPSSRPVTDLRPEWESEKLDRLAGGQQASCDATG